MGDRGGGKLSVYALYFNAYNNNSKIICVLSGMQPLMKGQPSPMEDNLEVLAVKPAMLKHHLVDNDLEWDHDDVTGADDVTTGDETPLLSREKTTDDEADR